MKIVVDIYGGDNSPNAMIDGAVEALAQIGGVAPDFGIVLAGDEQMIAVRLDELGCSAASANLSVLHAPNIIDCDESPTAAIKRKPDSSLVKALRMVSEGEADAVVSAGSTGALLTGATFIVKRIKGVLRPALAPILPTLKGPVLLIDCGANVDSKPEYLRQFALMGSAYMQKACGINAPRVGLINNGAEAAKGNELTKSAHALLAATDEIVFTGNCEARDILSGDYDVLVCDGFVGNVILKHTEGMAHALTSMLKHELMSGFTSKLGAALSRNAFARFKMRLDYNEYGGAPFLGVNGGVVKAHGSSDAKAIASAVRQAYHYVEGGVTDAIAHAMIQSSVED
ncbi:MAG: phosphate acyltransferase PlsX [Clostridia bacterium]|nr:phosphate acyltransferase PlsX [Clostridia bacterium]